MSTAAHCKEWRREWQGRASTCCPSCRAWRERGRVMRSSCKENEGRSGSIRTLVRIGCWRRVEVEVQGKEDKCKKWRGFASLTAWGALEARASVPWQWRRPLAASSRTGHSLVLSLVLCSRIGRSSTPVRSRLATDALFTIVTSLHHRHITRARCEDGRHQPADACIIGTSPTTSNAVLPHLACCLSHAGATTISLLKVAS